MSCGGRQRRGYGRTVRSSTANRAARLGEKTASLQNRVNLGGGLLERNTGSKPSKRGDKGHAEAKALPSVRPRHGGKRPPPIHVGRPDLLLGTRKEEPFGKHAGDGVRRTVEVEDGSDNIRIGSEATDPGSVAHQDDPIRPDLCFLLREQTSEVGCRTKQREQRWRNPRRAERHRAVRLQPLEDGGLVRTDLLERFRLLHDRGQRGVRNELFGLLEADRLGDAHDGAGVRIRQRPDQHAVDDAEHRHIRTDPQGEHQHDGGREPGTTPHGAGRVAQVSPQVVQPAPAPHIARAFTDQHRVAQCPTRRRQSLRFGNPGVPLPLPLELHVKSEFLLQVRPGLAASEVRHEPTDPRRPSHQALPVITLHRPAA